MGLEDGRLEHAEEGQGEEGEGVALELGRGLPGDALEHLLEVVDDLQLQVDEGHLRDEGRQLLPDDRRHEGLVVDGAVDLGHVAGGLDAVVVHAEHPLPGLVGVEEGGLEVEGGGGAVLGRAAEGAGVGFEGVHDGVVPGEGTRRAVPCGGGR